MWTSARKRRFVKYFSETKLWFVPQRKIYLRPIKMAYKIYQNQNTNESASPLIVTHDLFGSKNLWHRKSDILMKKLHRRVYAIDLRNHGESPHTEEYTYQHVTADLLKFINDQNIPKVSIFGHGMGGRAMMYFALENPGLVERGVVLDLMTLSTPDGLKRATMILLAMKYIQPSSFENQEEIQQNIEQAIKSPKLVHLVMSNLRQRDNGKFYWALNIDSLLNNLNKISDFMMHMKTMPPFSKPMLFFCGRNSTIINDNNWPFIQILFPNSEVHWMNVDNLTNISQSEDFYSTTLKFLTE